MPDTKAQNGENSENNNLILDNHKLPWHYDRIKAWEQGQRFAPVSIDMALTRACQASCNFCYAHLQEPQERYPIDKDVMFQFLEDCAEIGVKGISLISDGESSLNPAYIPSIKRASELGIDMGNATNGWNMTPERAEQVLPHLTWVRFTVPAGTPQGFVNIMHHDHDDMSVFWNAMRNISECVRIKRENDLDVTLGIQMVLKPEYADEIIPFAQLALDLGVDYGVIKHCSDDEFGSLGVDYEGYDSLEDLLKEAESMSNEDTVIKVKWSKINDGDKFPYKRVYGPPFLLQISGSGLVAPSGMFFNQRYSKFHIGNFTEERFIDIWKSDRYWDTMNYLASEKFNAQEMMGTLPIQHYVNAALDKHVRGEQRIEPPNEPDPPHVNFL